MRRTWLIFSQAVTVAVAVLFVVATLKPEWLRRAPGSVIPTLTITETPVLLSQDHAPGSLAPAAKRASPSVVNIATSKAPVGNPHFNDPWFRFFFGDPADDQPQTGLGSGVIVAPEGYLLTNNHVIEGADDIEVSLVDGRKASAQVVGTDPETDLAVLKIDLPDLPAISFGDAAALQVGDVVLAIGNPFGVGQTVTAGIVSALGRNQLGINTFENFIQTDAAINPGNSGGALVDVAGNLMGINTAIYSRSGGSMGIGFAIPATTARQVMESLIRDGRVTRGWIGVEPQDLTPELAQTFNLPIREGVLITGVLQGGPAQEAGIRPGDVVVRVQDQPVTSTVQLLNAVAALRPEARATIEVQRAGERLAFEVKVAQRPPLQRTREGR
jgi:serine protease DegQ